MYFISILILIKYSINYCSLHNGNYAVVIMCKTLEFINSVLIPESTFTLHLWIEWRKQHGCNGSRCSLNFIRHIGSYERYRCWLLLGKKDPCKIAKTKWLSE